MVEHTRALSALRDATARIRNSEAAVKRVNLPKSMAVTSAREHILAVEAELQHALNDCQKARQALARPSLSVVS